jgi:hypothetical protein
MYVFFNLVTNSFYWNFLYATVMLFISLFGKDPNCTDYNNDDDCRF